jgi:HPt (histidine-containing phosphotransfer) domain-containing protein
VLGEGELRALELMRAQYSADLPNLVAGLQAAVKQLAASPRDLAVQGVARRRAHQIAGTAGSFGFAAIGDACAGLEQTIVALQAGGELGPVEAALRALVLADFPELG